MTLHFDVNKLRRHCGGNRLIGRAVVHLLETDSTNDRCHELVSEGADEGTVVFADVQTTGRGQQGRRWSAPPNAALLLSILLRPPKQLNTPEFLTAWSAVGVARMLANYSLTAAIKWPNDVLVRDRKICGILVERRQATVVGIGLNVAVRPDQFPDDLRWPATSMEPELDRDVDRTAVAGDLLVCLDHAYQDSVENGPNSLFHEWTRFATPALSTQVAAQTRETRVEGRLLELRPDLGARLLRDDGAVARIPPEQLVRLHTKASAPESTGEN